MWRNMWQAPNHVASSQTLTNTYNRTLQKEYDVTIQEERKGGNKKWISNFVLESLVEDIL
jgi:hypothetical protein